MQWKSLAAIFAAFASIASVGCSQRLIDFTIISSKNVDLARAASFKRADTRVDGSDTAYMVLFIPTGVPHVKDAVDRAIEKVPGGVALVDGVVRQNWWTAILFGATSIVVEGTPLIDTRTSTGEVPKSNYMASYVDPVSNETKLVYLDKEGFAELKNAIDRGDGNAAEQLLLIPR